MLKRKLLAFVVAFTLVFSAMATGLAYQYIGVPTAPAAATELGTTIPMNPQTVTKPDYSFVFANEVTSVNNVISPVIKVLDNRTGKFVTGDDLKYFYNDSLTLYADRGTLVFDSNGNGVFDINDTSVAKITTSGYVYYDNNGNVVTPEVQNSFKLYVNSDKTGFVIKVPEQPGLWSTIANPPVPFLVSTYGRIWVTGQYKDTSTTKSVEPAYLYMGGASPIVQSVSRDEANTLLETFPETVIVRIPYAQYDATNDSSDFVPKIVIKENGKVFAEISLDSENKGKTWDYALNAGGVVDGYKVVLPPMSSTNTYTLTTYALVQNINWNTRVSEKYFAQATVNLKVLPADTKLLAPEDKVLAAKKDDIVTFTLNDKLPKGNTSLENKELVVNFAKFVRFTVLKGDKATVDDTVTKLDSLGTIKPGQWYYVGDKGLQAVTLDTTKKEVLGDPIIGTYDKDSGKITIKANIPVGDYLRIEGAYTDYVGNGYEPDLKAFERTFIVAELQAKPGHLTVDPDKINAGEYRNVTFTVVDVHGNAVPNAVISFSAPIAFIGGTGTSGYSGNVTSRIETDKNGKVVATLYSEYATNIMVNVDYPVEETPYTLTVNPHAKTGAKVVFTIGSDKYTVNGVEKTMDAVPYVKDGRTLVPARYIADAINAQSYYDQDTKVVTFVKGDTIVKFTLGSNKMQVIKNGVVVATQTMETKATTLDASGKDVGRTFILARYLAEAFGYKVDWDAANQTVTIY